MFDICENDGSGNKELQYKFSSEDERKDSKENTNNVKYWKRFSRLQLEKFILARNWFSEGQ